MNKQLLGRVGGAIVLTSVIIGMTGCATSRKPVQKIKQQFLKSSRIKKRIGGITVTVNSFVPKPFTPFQWAAMDDERTLKKKIKMIKDGLKKVANVRVHADIPRWAYIQAMFSRGDRKVSEILTLAKKK